MGYRARVVLEQLAILLLLFFCTAYVINYLRFYRILTVQSTHYYVISN